MKQTINLSQFRDEFNAIRPNQFSYEALELIYDYLEECSPDFDLDVIAICCDFCEMTELEIRSAYGLEDCDSSTAYLENNTFIVGTTKTTVIFQNF
jgi:hypothetical protein